MSVTSSCAVAKRPRDASCLSVVSFIASINTLSADFLLSVTSTSNLPVCTIRFCYVVFGVTSSLAVIHMIHGRPVYSARPRLVSLALYTVTDNRGCVQRIALGRPIPTVNRKPVAKCKIQTRVQQLLIVKPDIC